MGNRDTLAIDAIMINCILLMRILEITSEFIFFVTNVKNVTTKVMIVVVPRDMSWENTLKLHLLNARFVRKFFSMGTVPATT